MVVPNGGVGFYLATRVGRAWLTGQSLLLPSFAFTTWPTAAVADQLTSRRRIFPLKYESRMALIRAGRLGQPLRGLGRRHFLHGRAGRGPVLQKKGQRRWRQRSGLTGTSQGIAEIAGRHHRAPSAPRPG